MSAPAIVVCFRCRRPVGFVFDQWVVGGWRAVCFCFLPVPEKR